MPEDDIQVSLSGLTELERLDLEETVGKNNIRIVPQPTPSGQMGEPGTLEAIILISHAAIPYLGAALAIWLTRKTSGARFKDDLTIETPQGKFRRKVSITSSNQEAAKPEVINILTEFAKAVSAPGSDTL